MDRYELRHSLYNLVLNALESGLIREERGAPVPGMPLDINIVIKRPYSVDADSARRFRVTIEEITEDKEGGDRP